MMITRENYEAYFLDYHEKSLTAEQTGELMNFLSQNPDLKSEFDSFELITLSATPDFVLLNKDSFKKTEGDHAAFSVLDTRLIAHFEGDLSHEDSALLLEEVAQNPDIRREFQLFANTRIQPDEAIIFTRKSALKHYTLGNITPMLQRFAVAAALLAFMISLYFYLPRLNDAPEFAHTDPVATTPINTHDSEIVNPGVLDQESGSAVVAQQVQPKERTTTEPAATHIQRTMPAPMLVAQLQSLPAQRIYTSSEEESIAPREEFAWFTFTGRMPEYEEENLAEEASPYETPYTSLASLAYSGLERSTGIDFARVEKEVSGNRLSFWDLAGVGLAGIGQLTGTSLTVDKERDENGRITMLAIGDRFRVKR